MQHKYDLKKKSNESRHKYHSHCNFKHLFIIISQRDILITFFLVISFSTKCQRTCMAAGKKEIKCPSSPHINNIPLFKIQNDDWFIYRVRIHNPMVISSTSLFFTSVITNYILQSPKLKTNVCQKKATATRWRLPDSSLYYLLTGNGRKRYYEMHKRWNAKYYIRLHI